VIQGSNL